MWIPFMGAHFYSILVGGKINRNKANNKGK